ncbi:MULTISPECIES: hypothetical protein [Nocardiaceae]|uniref:Phage prohead protease, HK97 family n=1 Tax=Rhodococcoides kroppenstedtii TaxID=293050 RepID=A0ABS7NS17_9NOCA|nr:MULTISPECIES: hypothetical protein [Rhodococcus]MBY6312154.1 hypothetical protein [Rhodococcus kroppenstedtii]MBY6319762.1 hypothetical protein [Rhodococcus kroppenstedtii]MBY6398445.1 hypothetical protein [Rhodococcus kroppenstedtii]
MASENNQGRVFAVRFVPPESGSLFETPTEQLRARLTPGASSESYGREWRIGRVQTRDDVLTGRLGFSGEGGVEEIWDDEAKDFRDQISYRGVTTVFAVHLEQFTGLVQDRAPAIKVDSAIRALRLILNDGIKDKTLHWKVEAYRRKATLSEWRRSVTRVTKVRFSLSEPNPSWKGSRNVEDLFNETGSRSATAIFENALGLNVDAEFIKQSQNHVDRGYGDGRYTGVKEGPNGEVTESKYNSAIGIEEQNDELAADPNGEVNVEVMRSHLLELPPTSAVATLAESDETEEDETPESIQQADDHAEAEIEDRLLQGKRVYDEAHEVLGDDDAEGDSDEPDGDAERELRELREIADTAHLPELPSAGDNGEGDDDK